LVLNYLDVLNAIRPRGSQGKEKGVIEADTLTNTRIKMMKVKTYPIHVQLVKVVEKAKVEELVTRGVASINF
jgi:hypothetical protein